MEPRVWKMGLAAGLVAATLGGAAIGMVNAEPGTPGQGNRQGWQNHQQSDQWKQQHEQYLTTLAGKLNVSVDTLKQAMQQTRTQLGVNHQNGGGGMGPGRGMGVEAVAQALRITREQLWQELPGKSITDVARAHNVDPATLAASLKTSANTRIDQMAAGKNMTADQIAKMKQDAAQRIDSMMTRVFPAGGFMHGQGQ